MKYKFLVALAFILATSLAHAELPKEVVLDMHIRSAASHFKNQQYQQCLDELDQAEKLAGGKLSSDLIFIRAKSNLELNRFEQAKQYATRYIELEGKKGRYYDQALELFISIDERIKAQEQRREQERKDKIADLLNRTTGSYEQSFKNTKEAAELGDVGSMYHVAHYIKIGWTVDINPAQAIQWYEKAIQGGHKAARVEAGQLYYIYAGTPGFPPDRKRAFQLLDGVTQGPHTENVAAHNMYVAGMYLFGDGVSKDVDKGLALLEQVVAEKPHPLHETINEYAYAISDYVGYLYASGSVLVGGKPDGKKAMEWFRKPLMYDKKQHFMGYTKHIYPNIVAPYCYETGFCGMPAEPEKAKAIYDSVVFKPTGSVAFGMHERSNAYTGIGRIELQRGSWKEAERAFRCATGDSEYWRDCYNFSRYSNETDSTAYFYLAMIRATSKNSSQRNAKGAQEAFSKAKGGPKWFVAMVNAAVLAETGDFEQAVVKQQEAITLAAAGIEEDRDIWEQMMRTASRLTIAKEVKFISQFNPFMFNRSEKASYSEYWRQFLPEQLASYQQKKPWRYSKQEESSGGFDPFNL